MKKSEKQLLVGAAVLLAGGCAVYILRKCQHNATPKICDGHDNLVSKKPVPKELETSVGDDVVFFGDHPEDETKQIGKPAELDGHIGVFGESSRGKTSGIVIPNMATFSGPQFILDTKGNLAEEWHRQHQDGSKILKEFRISALGENPYWFDPFEPMRVDSDNKCGHAWDLAEAIIPEIRGDTNPVWRHCAQNLLAGAMLYYFDQGQSFVDALSHFSSICIPKLVKEIAEDTDSVAAVYVRELNGIEPKVLLNVGMDLKKVVQMLTTPAIREAISDGDGRQCLSLYEFSTRDVKYDIVFEAPDALLGQLRPLVVLVVTQLMRFLSMRPEKFSIEKAPPQMLLLLDEFPRLGKIPSITEGLNTLRSRGVTFLLCVQSIASLEEIYGSAAARVVLENLSYKLILGATDVQSEEYFSKLVGDILIEVSSSASGVNFPAPAVTLSVTTAKMRRPCIYPHAFQTLQDVIVVSPFGTCLAKKRRPKPVSAIHPTDNVQHELKGGHSHDIGRAVKEKSAVARGEREGEAGKGAEAVESPAEADQ